MPTGAGSTLESVSRQYFSERQGRGPKAEPMPFEAVRRLTIGVLDNFRERGYLQEAFGYECVDAGDVPGSLGSDRAAYFIQTIMREHVWPYWGPDYSQVPANLYVQEGDLDPVWTEWDADTLFDVLEVLHDQVSGPTDGDYHGYNDCGMHWRTFDGPVGRQEYRDRLNQVLRLHDPPYEMNEQGEIIESGPVEFRPLLDAELPEDTEPEVLRKVSEAVKLFQGRGASIEDRQRAVRDLADALERLRQDVKAELLPADERALYDIANNFAIRHLNRRQRVDYNRSTWLRWMFYVYLATVHAVVRVRESQSGA